MQQKVYNFKKKDGFINDKKFIVPDYFEYYHTGIEKIIPDDMLMITERYNNERAEVLSYLFLESENLSDTLLSINNDTYLWGAPYDNDMYEAVKAAMFIYIEQVHKSELKGKDYEKFNALSKDLVKTDDEKLRSVIIPRKEFIQKISRDIKDYIKSRKVE